MVFRPLAEKVKYTNCRGKECQYFGCTNKARVFNLCKKHYDAVYYHEEKIDGKRMMMRDLVVDNEKDMSCVC